MSRDIVAQSSLDDFLKYLTREDRIVATEDGIDIFASQAEMAKYFGVTVQAVSLHINRYEKQDPERFRDLFKESLNRLGTGRPIRLYNSDVIIYVGYRVNSTEQTRAFRNAIASMFRNQMQQHIAELQKALLNSQQVNRWLAENQRAGYFLEHSLPRSDLDD